MSIKCDYTESEIRTKKRNLILWLTALISESDQQQTVSIMPVGSDTLGVICIGIKE